LRTSEWLELRSGSRRESEINDRQVLLVVLVALPMMSLPDRDLRYTDLTKGLILVLLLQMQPVIDFLEIILVFCAFVFCGQYQQAAGQSTARECCR